MGDGKSASSQDPDTLEWQDAPKLSVEKPSKIISTFTEKELQAYSLHEPLPLY